MRKLILLIVMLFTYSAVAQNGGPPPNAYGSFNILTPQQVGASCAGVDDTLALAAWAAQVNAGKVGYIPAGSVCATTAPIAFANGVKIYGDGPGLSELIYTGATTTGNIFTFGPNAGNATIAYYIAHIDFESNTTMTSGYLVLFQNGPTNNGRPNIIDDIWSGAVNITTAYNAIGFNGIGTTNFSNFFLTATHDNWDVANSVGSGFNASFGFSKYGNIGLHLGGNVGGFYGHNISFGSNIQNVLEDEGIVAATPNRTIEFDTFTTFDILASGTSADVQLAVGDSTSTTIFNSDWFSIGVAGGNGCELQIDSSFTGTVIVNGTTFINGNTGICNVSATAKEYINDNTFVTGMTTAIHDTGSDPNLFGQFNQLNGSVLSGLQTGQVFAGIVNADLNVRNTVSANGAGAKFIGNGGTTPSKTIRVVSGALQITNDAVNKTDLLVNDNQTVGTQAFFATAGTPILTTGTCTGTAWTGGMTVGKFTAPTCAAGTIILTGLPTVNTGYSCTASDMTTPANTLKQTATTTASVTFTSTTTNNDAVVVQCLGY